MVYTPDTADFSVPARVTTPPATSKLTFRRPVRATTLTRRYEITGLTDNGLINDFTAVAPATPDFEEAFGAFARGTLIATAEGPVAVEDLLPGMKLETADNGPTELLWKGSMMIFPEIPDIEEDACRLTRLTADSFGVGRPMPDLMLGPRARLLYRNSGCQTMFGTNAAFAPARAFIDGFSMISVKPATPVRVYHLALDGQQTLCANGMEVESYHPGNSADTMMDPKTRELFLSLFPHIRTMEDFGQMSYPRLTAFELDGMRAA